MKLFDKIKNHLCPGVVYRRADLLTWSNAVDRHLEQLQKMKVLKKLSGGLYYCPKKTIFGESPPSEKDVVKAFLKDNRFLMFNQSIYNSLNVGTTQLYNKTIVYNHKRHGTFKLGNQLYCFVRKDFFPLNITGEFLIVDLLNNVTTLAEDTEFVLKNIVQKARQMNTSKLKKASADYGGIRARKFLTKILNENEIYNDS